MAAKKSKPARRAKTKAEEEKPKPSWWWALVAVVVAVAVGYVAFLKGSSAPSHVMSYSNREPLVPFPLPPLHDLPSHPLYEEDTEKVREIRTAFAKSWNAYKRHAWGYDEFHPLSKSGSNLLGKDDAPLGYTMVDALDMLILLGMKEEYVEAREWIRTTLHWDIDGRLNVFETTIRVLGGLLSASALMLDPPAGALPRSLDDAQLFLDKAATLAERMLPAFQTPSGIPKREINLATGEAFFDTDNRNASSLAEATTIQLEFKYLAERLHNATYWSLAERPMQVALDHSKPPEPGVLPIFVDPISGQFYAGEVRLGSRGDSYYEYLVKQYLQTNRTEDVYRAMYEHAFSGIKAFLLGKVTSVTPPLVHTLEMFPRQTMMMELEWLRRTKQDHLVCFLGGTMMTGAAAQTYGPLTPPMAVPGIPAARWEDWQVGHELIRSCVDTYTASATGLGAEIVFFNPPGYSEPNGRAWRVKRANRALDPYAEALIDSRNILRPETIESLYIAFQLTGDPVYREWGWTIFQSFQRWCQVDGGDGGYAGIDDVDSVDHQQIDRMETFWLSETLKYFYLLFTKRDLLPFHQWVLNTEAHPLPVFTPTFLTHVE
ncbi:alpha-mannosidase [Malassezia pachydermatis]|uniref:alpha-1,2-Mannosidase n=1 Tax=Malassezia pachydermatis TaxID=77020 RepID=A0A0M9VQK5_9BASI|nr:alpha-mannosidase [Malassezia pachydermatis]KOS15639.1 alpha-mannosidase [Malassezia pachydermatis]